MNPEQFCQAGEELFGKRWRTKLAAELDISKPTVYRYSRGLWPVPRPIKLAILKLLSDKRKTRR